MTKLDRNIPILKKIEEYVHNDMNCLNTIISFNCNRNTFTYSNYQSDCEHYVKKQVKKNKRITFELTINENNKIYDLYVKLNSKNYLLKNIA